MANQQDFEPIDGVCFWCEPMPAVRLSGLLCEVAAFLQDVDRHAAITQADDWLEHDGLYFRKEPVDFSTFFESIGSPRALLGATPEDEYVYCGFEDGARRWYLRFRVEWDEVGFEISGDFALTLNDVPAESFESKFKDHGLHRESAAEYFRRITM